LCAQEAFDIKPNKPPYSSCAENTDTQQATLSAAVLGNAEITAEASHKTAAENEEQPRKCNAQLLLWKNQ